MVLVAFGAGLVSVPMPKRTSKKSKKQCKNLVNGSVDVDLMVTGLIPGFEVSATAYILVLQIQNSSGATYNIASSTSPSTDIGAQDQNQQKRPTSNNNSTISL